MDRRLALETAKIKIDELDKFLNEVGCKAPVNIIDSGYTALPLSELAEACDNAKAYLDEQINNEWNNDIYN